MLNNDSEEPIQPFNAWFWGEKIEGHGEDADPYVVVRGRGEYHEGALAVFDGLGGAGSERYTDRSSPSAEGKTGAKIAAYAAREAFRKYAEDNDLDFSSRHAEDFSSKRTILYSALKAALQAVNDNYQSTHATQLRSAMRRLFPTTFASAFFANDKTQCSANVIWAGDSRVYALSTLGLQLLTLDDVRRDSSVPLNHMEMVDAPITNCLEHDKQFALNHKHYQFEMPVILIAATDGCFGYVKTPVHFEQLLLNELQADESISMDTWGNCIRSAIGACAQDDYSMALVCNGWQTFASMKAAFCERIKYLNEMIQQRNDSQQSTLKHSAQTTEQQFLSQDAWHDYTAHYGALLKEPSHGN